MQRLRLASLFLIVLVACSALAATARADGPGRVTFFPPGGGGPTCTAATMCSHASDCSVPGESCQTVPGVGTFCVRALASELFCCTPATPGALICPSGSFCAMVGAGAGAIGGICVDSGRNLCVAAGSISDADISRIASCFMPPIPPCIVPPPPRGLGPVPYAMGDCDGDGIENGADATRVCAVDTPVCLDAGVGDASVMVLDGSITVSDAGPPLRDAGTNADLGDVGEPDLGPPGEDAGTPPVDAGSLSMDSGTLPPGVTFRGAGGCNCSADGGGVNGVALSLFALVALSLVLVRRRK